MKKILQAALAVALLALLPALAHAQGARYHGVAFSPSGRPIPGATITVCTSAGTGLPCTPTAPIYSNQALTTSQANPFVADPYGNYGFWAAPGTYVISVTAPGFLGYGMPVTVPCSIGVTGCAASAAPGDGIQYVSNGGSDSNDGLSWGSAKATLAAACAALPGGDVTCDSGAGTVFVSPSYTGVVPYRTTSATGSGPSVIWLGVTSLGSTAPATAISLSQDCQYWYKCTTTFGGGTALQILTGTGNGNAEILAPFLTLENSSAAGGVPLEITASSNTSSRPIAAEPLPADGIQFVSPTGSDSNDGLSWGTAKLTLAAAYAALPQCTAKGVKSGVATETCGTIEASGQSIPIGSAITITSPLVSIKGRGPAATQFVWNGAGSGITLNFVGSVDPAEFQAGTYSGFSIDGSGNTNANSSGMTIEDLSMPLVQNISISGFTQPGDSCLNSAAVNYWDERQNFDGVWLGNCTVGWLISTDTIAGQADTTLGYGFFNIYINAEAGQTAIESIGTSSTAVRMDNSLFHIIINGDTSTSTCFNFQYSDWSNNAGLIHCETNGVGVTMDANSHVIFGGEWYEAAASNSIAPGGTLITRNVDSSEAGSYYYFNYSNNTPSTATTTGQGFNELINDTYWNGTASALDQWKIQTIPSSGASFLSFQHTAGPSSYQVDVNGGLRIDSGGFGSTENTLIGNTAGYYTNFLPASSGTLALAGANGVSAGTISISASTSGSYTFATAYAVAPDCTATPQSNPGTVTWWVAPATATAVTVDLSAAATIAFSFTCSPGVN